MSHSKLDVAKHWSTVVMLSIASGVAATGTNPVPELPEPVEPGCYRGRYVAPVDSAAGADPYAPRDGSPYWIRAELTDAQGRKTLPAQTIECTWQLRFGDHDPRAGMNPRIDLDIHPIPLMFMNAKIYPINVKITGGLSKTIRVKADVGRRGFEADWFAEFEGRLVSVLGLGPEVAVPGGEVTFRVDEVNFAPVQSATTDDKQSTKSRVSYVGELTLKEPVRSLVHRHWERSLQALPDLALQQLVIGASAVLGTVCVFFLLWFRRPHRGGQATAAAKVVARSKRKGKRTGAKRTKSR